MMKRFWQGLGTAMLLVAIAAFVVYPQYADYRSMSQTSVMLNFLRVELQDKVEESRSAGHPRGRRTRGFHGSFTRKLSTKCSRGAERPDRCEGRGQGPDPGPAALDFTGQSDLALCRRGGSRCPKPLSVTA